MNRTQHWLMALLLTTTLLSIGIIITLINRSPMAVSQPPAQNAMAVSTMPEMPLEKTTPVNYSTLSEPLVRQKATALLPSQTIESVKKVNYEGQLAYQVTTAQNLLYLNAKTGDVLVMTPRPAQQLELVQVSYQAQNHESDEHQGSYEQGEHEEGEHDDD